MKKIVIIGPESTGKSTLCEKLADHFHTNWCPEYAREYLMKHGTNYTYDTLLEIAKGQIVLEDKFINLVQSSPLTAHYSPLLFIDTDMYVMNVWSKFVFGKTHSWILNQVIQRRYDLYLLCNVDLPWVKDELREYPDLARREQLYHIYKEIMIHQSVPWVDISGNYDERLQKAIDAVENL
jgi:NadR type nicotinamide-nucleotide adenylyltransferase